MRGDGKEIELRRQLSLGISDRKAALRPGVGGNGGRFRPNRWQGNLAGATNAPDQVTLAKNLSNTTTPKTLKMC